MSEALYKKIGLIGCGLIGSSLSRATRLYGLAEEIIVFAREGRLAEIRDLGLADVVSDDPSVLADCDIVFFCTPVGTYRALGERILPVLKAGAVVSDVGSVKQQTITQLLDIMPDHVHFIPGHPIAGTENSGPSAGFAELFIDRWLILTPLEEHAHDTAYQDALHRLEQFWHRTHARVTCMKADHHDRVLAMTSHLPHLIAYTIVDTAVNLGTDLQAEVIQYSAGGFRDFTRIAASDPTMWRDIFLMNREAVLDGLQRFTEDLTELQKAIRRGDGEKLFETFTRTRAVRRSIIDQRQHIPEESKKKS
jgi:cyclohexadieny/prephenate dehydrogenase